MDEYLKLFANSTGTVQAIHISCREQPESSQNRQESPTSQTDSHQVPFFTIILQISAIFLRILIYITALVCFRVSLYVINRICSACWLMQHIGYSRAFDFAKSYQHTISKRYIIGISITQYFSSSMQTIQSLSVDIVSNLGLYLRS